MTRPRRIDLVGKRYCRLEVLEFAGLDQWRAAKWRCRCDCGTEKIIRGDSLRDGRVKSCGCFNRDSSGVKKRFTAEETQVRKQRNWQNWYARNREAVLKKAAIRAKAISADPVRRRHRSQQMQARLDRNPEAKLALRLRQRLNVALRRGYKTGSAVRDLGCSVANLRRHLESQFYVRRTGEEMSWENYGRGGWDIDHIEPLVRLSHGDCIQALCHYTNLQPLWREDNLEKRSGDLCDLQANGIAA